MPRVSILGFLEWLDTHAWSTALHESQYMYPLVESTHVVTLMLFVGLTVMWDLRLLGVAFTSVPISDMGRRILPWIRVGFVVMFTTGVLLFYAIPVRSYQNIFFRVKMIVLVLALLNIWYFHTRTEKTISAWDTALRPPAPVRLAALASLTLWAVIVVSGRLIAYNWFDCDIQPQSDFINWAAGCVIGRAE